MTTPELQRAARAAYEFFSDDGAGHLVTDPWDKASSGRQERWCRIARACFESALPVSNEMVQAAMDEDVAHQGMVSEREVITAAIRHITTGGDNT